MMCSWTKLAVYKWIFLLLLILFPAGLCAQFPSLGDNSLRQLQSCPVVKEPDTCQRTFFKEYTSSSGFIRMRQIMKSGKDFLIPAIWRTAPNWNMDWLGLVKMDTAGHLKETRLLGLPNLYISKLIALRDGNFLIFGTYGNSSTFAELYFAKIDPQLNIIWEQKLTSTPYFNTVAEVVESKEGDLYCYVIDHEINNIEARVAMKLTATGQPVWIKKFNTGPNNFLGQGEYIAAIVELGDNIILKYNEEVSDFSPHLMSLKKSDGSINWVRKYQMDGPFGGSNAFKLNTLLSDGTNIYMQGYTQGKDIFLKIRPDGSMGLAKKVVSSTVICGDMSFRADGRLLLNVANITLGGISGVLEMDTSFNVLRSQYMQRPGDLGFGGVAPVGDSLVYESGTFWNPDAHIASLLFVKYNFNSSFGNCAVADQPFVLSEINQPTVTKTVPQSSPALPVQNAITTTILPLDMCYAAYYCGNAPACTDIKLQGPETICDTSNVYSFKVEKNSGCNGMVGWSMDTIPQQVRIVSKTDAELQLKVLKSGNFKIHSRVFASCGWLEDSISVTANAQNTSLDLGKDTVLCEGNTMILHAGAWFSSYQWQDGSTDSVFAVKAPGLYYVQVAACDNLISDSIVVGPQPKIPFDIGPDRTKCNSDTLHLNAPAGFISYSWGPNYNISYSNAISAIINPLVDTMYYVKAQKSPGCFVYDSVTIKVHTSPGIGLGRDTSFCIGNAITLSAPSMFSAYLWNTGASTQQITVSTAGSYSVRAKTIEGCYSSDTIIVASVYPLPVINLDKNPEICYGGSRLLDAGAFNSYVWQNGSTKRTLVATTIGTYYVTVTDQHGCVNSDTTILKTVVPVPDGFLPPDMSLCTYETKVLKPSGTYQQYLWSTGAANASIDISRGGLYWLQVVDSKGCKGVDSTIVIAKDCMEGVYIPTAFSPNNDRRNDEFRVLAFGKIQAFELTLYNRWGQIVFKSNDRLKGWDGKVAGRLQDSGAYIWTCQYQLEGQPKQSKKGTVMLIR
ncbi:MAG: gliding motility-associated C-terminal domain-containing protein [Chitinophagaceae bacterium]